jgi:hypothetical protein
MKIIEEIGWKNNIRLFHVESEPGDATHYSYIIMKNVDDFSIMPYDNDFNYPQKLNYWKVKELTENEIIELAIKKYCNPYTLKEVIKTIKVMHEK